MRKKAQNDKDLFDIMLLFHPRSKCDLENKVRA